VTANGFIPKEWGHLCKGEGHYEENGVCQLEGLVCSTNFDLFLPLILLDFGGECRLSSRQTTGNEGKPGQVDIGCAKHQRRG